MYSRAAELQQTEFVWARNRKSKVSILVVMRKKQHDLEYKYIVNTKVEFIETEYMLAAQCK